MSTVDATRSAADLKELAGVIATALGICRVGLAGQTQGLKPSLQALGMACPEKGPVDAWVWLTDLAQLEQGLRLPAVDVGQTVFVACRNADAANSDAGAGASPPLRARMEAMLIRAGYIKDPANTELFGYAQLDANPQECWGLFQYRPAVYPETGAEERFRLERDLHTDMLREAGVRSDAHVVRYQLAASLVRPGDTVLDAACGLGYGSYTLSSLSPAARVIGIDLSDWAIDFARHNYGAENTVFRCAQLPEALDDMEADSVDFIASLETLEHVPDPVALLAAFNRVLKPGGRIFVSVPNDWADETGQDPNPHHLHVYDWSRIHREISTHFLVESAWSLTAGGCKSMADRLWRAQPRKLQQVPLADAPKTEGEWWLVCATKSPLAAHAAPYHNTVHGDFQGRTHLVDFSAHYDCPWLVHAMVELPWRIRDKTKLTDIAQQVIRESRPDSADRGAGLTVFGWRLLEEMEHLSSETSAWLTSAHAYITQTTGSRNPHVLRWRISLEYLCGRLHQMREEYSQAQQAYQHVLQTDVQSITPTLGTKVADAAVRAGMLHFLDNQPQQAIASWQAGIQAVFTCLQAEPIEFLGNPDRPFIHAMNDLVELADGATRLANAISAVTTYPHDRNLAARQLARLTQRSLRSALSHAEAHTRQLATELGTLSQQLSASAHAQLRAEALLQQSTRDYEALRLEFTGVETAKTHAESLAIARLNTIESLSEQLAAIETSKTHAEALAISRMDEIKKLHEQLSATETGKTRAEDLAISRLDEIMELGAQLSHTEAEKRHAEQLAITRLEEIQNLSEQLSKTTDLCAQLSSSEAEKTHAKHLAATQQEEIQKLSEQLSATQRLAQSHAQEAQQARQYIEHIQASRAYKLMSSLGLTPRKDN